ncbi:MAG: UPF0149 family protein [Cellvibrionales bacterium]|nr:UPF0149 family protein [Cellvibrionales bacterium]
MPRQCYTAQLSAFPPLPAAMPADPLAYPPLVDHLQRAAVPLSPAALHGHLCGRLIAGERLAEAAALTALVDYSGLRPPAPATLARLLTALYEWQAQRLDSDPFSLRLLLPDDAEPLPLRLCALADWCAEFLGGFGSAARPPCPPESLADEREILVDLAEIAKLDAQTTGSEEDEQHFAHLTEHVRLAVLNLHDLATDDGCRTTETGDA